MIDRFDDDDEAVVYVCLKEFLENGRFIKAVRHIFLTHEAQIDSSKIFDWINNLCTEKKYADNVKKEIIEFLDTLADRIDDDFSSFYALKKVFTTKRLV